MAASKQLVLNLYGGPGVGKSTGMAFLFSVFKMLGVNAEFAHEYAKDLTWEERDCTKRDQLYIFGKQQKRLNILRDKVELIVTDSPLLLSLVYGSNVQAPAFHELVRQIYESYDNVDFMLKRVKPYAEAGRSQTEDEARTLDTDISRQCLRHMKAPFAVSGDIDGYCTIATTVLQKIRPEKVAAWAQATASIKSAFQG